MQGVLGWLSHPMGMCRAGWTCLSSEAGETLQPSAGFDLLSAMHAPQLCCPVVMPVQQLYSFLYCPAVPWRASVVVCGCQAAWTEEGASPLCLVSSSFAGY